MGRQLWGNQGNQNNWAGRLRWGKMQGGRERYGESSIDRYFLLMVSLCVVETDAIKVISCYDDSNSDVTIYAYHETLKKINLYVCLDVKNQSLFIDTF